MTQRTPLPSPLSFLADDDGQPGLLGPTSQGWNHGSALTLVSGTAYCYRVYPRRDYSIASAWFVCSTASGTDDPVEVAVFNAALSTKVATTGSTTGKLNSTGEKTISLPVTLAARTPYVVTFLAASTASVRQTQTSSASIMSAFGTTSDKLLAFSKASQTIPLAAGMTAYAQTNIVPLLCLRES